jgi:hypothetical protein
MNRGLRLGKRALDHIRYRVMDLGGNTPKSTISVAVRNVMPIRAVSLASQRRGCGHRLEQKDA